MKRALSKITSSHQDDIKYQIFKNHIKLFYHIRLLKLRAFIHVRLESALGLLDVMVVKTESFFPNKCLNPLCDFISAI